jgi:NAD(P)H-dependent FMN reductase
LARCSQDLLQAIHTISQLAISGVIAWLVYDFVEFSKAGFLMRTIGSILEQRSIELRAIHAVDLAIPEDGDPDLTDQLIADSADQVQHAAAILLLTPATKETVPTLLIRLLERLPGKSFFDKPVLLFATGGLPAHVAVIERALRHELLRLGTTTMAPEYT